MISQLRNSRRGAAAIEFAMWLPVLAMLLGGVIDLTRFMSELLRVQRAAQDGARAGAAIVEGRQEVIDNGAATRVMEAAETRAESALKVLGYDCSDCVTVTMEYNDPIDRVVVDVSVPYFAFFNSLPIPADINGSFTMGTERQYDPDEEP